MSLERDTFTIQDITEGSQSVIELKYDQPDISVNTSQRFIEHDVIGGITLRQRVGEEPVEVSVSGVCTTEEARLIDELRFEEIVTITSNRISSMRVQIDSTSTQPLAQGGAVDMDREWTHTFSIEFVEAE